MRKGLLFIFLLLAFIFPGGVHAQDEFSISSIVLYSLSETGNAHVRHNITIKNNLPSVYIKSYSLNLQNINPINISASDTNQELPIDKIKSNEITEIKINFPDIIVGKDNLRKITLDYDVTNLLVKTGEVWEVTIPKLDKPETFTDYEVKLSTPFSFGKEAYISPKPDSVVTIDNRRVLTFSKKTISQSAVSAGFGEFQVFSFHFDYHLENPLNSLAQTEIALPPDTAFQRIFYEKLDPKPQSIKIDKDGNWLALYQLKPRQRVDVTAAGAVQIYAKERKLGLPNNLLTDGNEYWNITPDIKNVSDKLNSVRDIYNFVIDKLSYDVSRVAPNIERLGAQRALQSPNLAICMEYTDLFIALARAKGIPAREINGFAFTENPKLEPLSFVADVLHSWPEYFDQKRGIWVPIDPTWGDTTGGENFFDKLDLRHFTFVVHNTDPTKPYAPGSYKLGSNPQRDVYVVFGKLPDVREPRLILSYKQNGANYKVIVKNSGPSALYNTDAVILFDDQENDKRRIDYLLPFTEKEITVNIPFKLLGIGAPEKITFQLTGQDLEIANVREKMLMKSLLLVSGLFLTIITTYFIYHKRDFFKKIPKI